MSVPGSLAIAVIELLHVSLIPAGAGAILALVHASTGSRAPARLPVHVHSLADIDGTTGPPLPLLPPVGPVDVTAEQPRSEVVDTVVGIAVVATAASAVVHAMAGPHHSAEHLLFGLFFWGVAVVQFLWVTLALAAPERRLWREGIWLNAAVIVLWAVTRTVGLPFGLLDGPEEVGRWDVASKVWEVVALLCCLWLLRSPGATDPSKSRLNRLQHPKTLVHWALSISAVALVVLVLGGAPT